VALFVGLPQAELEALATCLRPRRVPRGTIIFLEGDPGESLYVIEHGTVKIALTSPEGKELVLALLGPGDFFGDLTLLDGDPHSADAVAKTDCRLLLLQRGAFLGFLETHPRAAGAMLAVLSRRLRRNTVMLQEAAFLDVPGRIASALLQLAERHGQAAPDGIVVASQVTQSELAGMVGATRESVNKWLRAFERQGLVRWSKGTITLLRAADLRRRVEG
jgi:CRP-like cAMP-binding protein